MTEIIKLAVVAVVSVTILFVGLYLTGCILNAVGVVRRRSKQ